MTVPYAAPLPFSVRDILTVLTGLPLYVGESMNFRVLHDMGEYLTDSPCPLHEPRGDCAEMVRVQIWRLMLLECAERLLWAKLCDTIPLAFRLRSMRYRTPETFVDLDMAASGYLEYLAWAGIDMHADVYLPQLPKRMQAEFAFRSTDQASIHACFAKYRILVASQ